MLLQKLENNNLPYPLILRKVTKMMFLRFIDLSSHVTEK